MMALEVIEAIGVIVVQQDRMSTNEVIELNCITPIAISPWAQFEVQKQLLGLARLLQSKQSLAQ